jgi:hypothetical protein
MVLWLLLLFIPFTTHHTLSFHLNEQQCRTLLDTLPTKSLMTACNRALRSIIRVSEQLSLLVIYVEMKLHMKFIIANRFENQTDTDCHEFVSNASLNFGRARVLDFPSLSFVPLPPAIHICTKRFSRTLQMLVLPFTRALGSTRCTIRLRICIEANCSGSTRLSSTPTAAIHVSPLPTPYWWPFMRSTRVARPMSTASSVA